MLQNDDYVSRSHVDAAGGGLLHQLDSMAGINAAMGASLAPVLLPLSRRGTTFRCGVGGAADARVFFSTSPSPSSSSSLSPPASGAPTTAIAPIARALCADDPACKLLTCRYAPQSAVAAAAPPIGSHRRGDGRSSLVRNHVSSRDFDNDSFPALANELLSAFPPRADDSTRSVRGARGGASRGNRPEPRRNSGSDGDGRGRAGGGSGRSGRRRRRSRSGSRGDGSDDSGDDDSSVLSPCGRTRARTPRGAGAAEPAAVESGDYRRGPRRGSGAAAPQTPQAFPLLGAWLSLLGSPPGPLPTGGGGGRRIGSRAGGDGEDAPRREWHRDGRRRRHGHEKDELGRRGDVEFDATTAGATESATRAGAAFARSSRLAWAAAAAPRPLSVYCGPPRFETAASRASSSSLKRGPPPRRGPDGTQRIPPFASLVTNCGTPIPAIYRSSIRAQKLLQTNAFVHLYEEWGMEREALLEAVCKVDEVIAAYAELNERWR
eukprot:GHVU01106482.1.p1 GENE.GHVU01106482.1~~GHVU01106482.1.p1  ORF type:complete len:491 (-),score=86.37 GHVU01106482.1:147-1619(-)